MHSTLSLHTFALLTVAGSIAVQTAHAYDLPPPDGKFDYQLGGSYDPEPDVRIVSRDSGVRVGSEQTAAPALALDGNLYQICYLNVLQTQPDDQAWWLQDEHRHLVLFGSDGQPVHDPDPEWAGEMILDVRTPENRAELLALETPWIAQCKNAGFAAIEPDNIGSYTRSDGLLDADQVQAFMEGFVAEAHNQGLAVAQKNVVEWNTDIDASGRTRAQSSGFDFSIIEECQPAQECAVVRSAYGDGLVFEVEYWYETEDSSSGVTLPAHSTAQLDAACADHGETVRVVLRNRDVRSKDTEGYYYAVCDGQLAASSDPGTASEPASEPDTSSEPVMSSEPIEPGTSSEPGEPGTSSEPDEPVEPGDDGAQSN
jgi:Glycoside-hydrolase family GH114